ncbi:MAG: glycosyltransferase family 2 protein [Bacteroidetes bacterium]|nr:glycosyltransferase family 2 protein [Bacteroidota bacterium]
MSKPFVSVVAPSYNEEAILEINIEAIITYMETLSYKYDWEVLIVNDGSKDNTAAIANALAAKHSCVRAVHHPTNLNLGNAIKTGFANSRGDIIVIMDIDLSYSEKYIEEMVDRLVAESADIVMASPYMKGGKVTAVPFMRRVMSKWVNRFMSFAAQDKYHTFTGMVRAYRKEFVQTLNLKTKDYEINPEIVYKAMILRAKIIEIPAHLDWTEQNKYAGKRTSSLRVVRSFFSGLMSGFIFRPYIFFIIIGSFLMLLSLYELVWLLYDVLNDLAHTASPLLAGEERSFSHSLAVEFKRNPQSFLVGGITFVIAIQFLSLGFLSLQSKRYFEELFHLGTSLRKEHKEIADKL